MQKGFTTFMKIERGFTPILIILLVAALVGGYFIYTNYSNNQTKSVIPQTQTPSPTQDPTANWKTYIDSFFKFNYPPTLKHKKADFFPFPATFFSPEEIVFVPNSEPPLVPMIVSIKQEIKLEEEIQKNKEIFKYKDFKDENVIIGGIKSRKISGVVTGESYVTGKFTIDVYIPKDNKIIHVSYLEREGLTAEDFNQILSTFRFD